MNVIPKDKSIEEENIKKGLYIKNINAVKAKELIVFKFDCWLIALLIKALTPVGGIKINHKKVNDNVSPNNDLNLLFFITLEVALFINPINKEIWNPETINK